MKTASADDGSNCIIHEKGAAAQPYFFPIFAKRKHDTLRRDTLFHHDANRVLTFAALLFAGVMLLRRRAIGRRVTLITVVVQTVVLLGLAVPSAIVATIGTSLAPQDEAGRVGFMVGGVLGVRAALLVRMAYPIVAAIILWRRPEELGLTQESHAGKNGRPASACRC